MNHLQHAVQRMKKETIYDGKKLLLRLDPFDEDSFNVYQPLMGLDDVYLIGVLPVDSMPDSVVRLLKPGDDGRRTTVVVAVLTLDFFVDSAE